MAQRSHTERERKFLIPSLPKRLSAHPHHRIRQGYLVTSDDGSEARLRQITAGRRTRHLLTIKRPQSRSARTELEIPLTPKQFSQLWPLTQNQRLQKTRYRIPHANNLTIELDRYHGPLRPLAVAEVEFPTPRRARAFRPPPWFGPDITHQDPYGNRSLARHGLPKRLKPR